MFKYHIKQDKTTTLILLFFLTQLNKFVFQVEARQVVVGNMKDPVLVFLMYFARLDLLLLKAVSRLKALEQKGEVIMRDPM